MKELGLDPKMYKYLKSDANSTTLQHKRGHTVTVAHSVLSPKNQAILKALAATDSQQVPQQKADGGYIKEIHSDETEPGYTPKMAHGGGVDTYGMGLPCLNPSCKSHGKPHPNCRCYGMAEGGMADNVHYCARGMPHKIGCEYYAEGGQQPEVLQTGSLRSNVYTAGNAPFNNQDANDITTSAQDAQRRADQDADDTAFRAKNPQPQDDEDAGYQDFQRQGLAKGGKPVQQSSVSSMSCEQPFAKGGRVSDREIRAQREARDESPAKPTGTNEGFSQKGGQTPIGQMSRERNLREFRSSKGPNIKGLAKGTPDGPIKKDRDAGVQSNDDAKGAGDHIMSGLHALGSWLETQGQKTAQANSGQPPQNPSTPPMPTNETPQDQVQSPPQDTTDYGDQGSGQVPAAIAAPDQSVPDAIAAPDQSVPDAIAAPNQDEAPQDQSQDAQPQQDETPQQAPVQQAPVQQAAPQQQAAPPTPQAYQQAVHNNIMDEQRAWSQDLSNGHIEPETYKSMFDKKDTLGKIGTLFGMMLSGAGSGLAHQPNMLLEMMNKQIENDLDAQKASSSNRQNYIKMAQAHELNKANILATQAGVKLTDAHTKEALQGVDQKAKMFMQRAALDNQLKLVNAMPEGPDKQLGLQAIASMGQKVDNTNSDIASQLATQRAALYASRYPGSSSAGDPNDGLRQQQEAAVLQEKGMPGLTAWRTSHSMPGVRGTSTKEVTKDDQNNITAYNTLNTQLKRLIDYTNQYSNLKGNVDPRIKAQIAINAHEAAALYNKTIDSLGMTEGRAGWLNKQVSEQPQGYMERLKGSKEQLQELIRGSNMRKNQLLTGLGFPKQDAGMMAPGGPQNSMEAAKAWLADPKNAKAPQYKAVQALVGRQ